MYVFGCQNKAVWILGLSRCRLNNGAKLVGVTWHMVGVAIELLEPIGNVVILIAALLRSGCSVDALWIK